MGSGTTLKVALKLGRRAIGYEIDVELLDVVKEKLKINTPVLVGQNPKFEIIVREGIRHLRTQLQEKVTKNNKRR